MNTSHNTGTNLHYGKNSVIFLCLLRGCFNYSTNLNQILVEKSVGKKTANGSNIIKSIILFGKYPSITINPEVRNSLSYYSTKLMSSNKNALHVPNQRSSSPYSCRPGCSLGGTLTRAQAAWQPLHSRWLLVPVYHATYIIGRKWLQPGR